MNRKKSPRLAADSEDAEDNDLLERLRNLELENLNLRNIIQSHGIAVPPISDDSNTRNPPKRQRQRRGSTNAQADPVTPKVGGRGGGCSCKGNCGTRVCGCVKKNAACTAACRCSNALCQNLELDKENIGDANELPSHSKKTNTQPTHPAFDPEDEPVAKVTKPRSLFSPVVDNQTNRRANVQVRNPSASDDENAMEQGEETEETVQEETTGKKGKKTEMKKLKVAPLKNNKRATSKARRRNKDSDSEAEEAQVENDDDDNEEEPVQIPAKGKGKATVKNNDAKKETKKAKPVTGPAKNTTRQASKARNRDKNSESEAESDETDNEDNSRKRVKAPIKMNDEKKETKKGKTAATTGKSENFYRNKARIYSESESDDEGVEQEPVNTGTKVKKNNVQEAKKQASPIKNAKRNTRKAPIESSSDSESDEMIEVGEIQEEEKESKKTRKNQAEAGTSSKNVESVERESRTKKNLTETTKASGSSNKQKNTAVESDDSSDDTDDEFKQHDEDDTKKNYTQIDSQEDVRSEQAELSPTFSTGSSDLSSTEATDNLTVPQIEYPEFDPMKPRHQLSRSPVHSQNESHIQRILDRSEIPLPVPIKEEVEEQPPEPEELKAAVVDWEAHQKNLVPCGKCGRKFNPFRLKKHEATCLNI